MSCSINDKEKRRQIFASAMYSSYQAGVSSEGDFEEGQTLWFFFKPFASKLIYSGAKQLLREMKINKVYTEI